jgi:hypothetical protein
MDGKGNEKPQQFTKFVPKAAPDTLGVTIPAPITSPNGIN